MEDPVLPDAVDPRDILVIELRGRSPLLVEPRDDFGIGGLIGRQELERDLTVELGVEGAKDRPHPADADRFFDQEPVEHIARHRQDRGVATSAAGERRSILRRAARPAMHRRRARPDAHAAESASVRRCARRQGSGLIAGFGRLGDRHRLVLNSSGFVPCRYFRARHSRRIDRDMRSDREVHAFQQSSHTIGEPGARCQSGAPADLPKYKQRKDLGFESARSVVRRSDARRAARRLTRLHCGTFGRPDQARQSAEPIQKESRSGSAPARAGQAAGG